MAVAALVLGILSILLLEIPEVALILSILAIIFGKIKLKTGGVAKAGFILGIISISILAFALLIVLAGSIVAGTVIG